MKRFLRVLQVSVFLATDSLPWRVSGFSPISTKNQRSNLANTCFAYSGRHRIDSKLNLFTQEQELEFWITTFSTAHISMSAIREQLIHRCGELASRADIVGRGLKLPSYWPGDDFGKDNILPDTETAGRQIYRFIYTMVSFATLGNALASYIHCDEMKVMILSEQDYTILYGVASISFAASIASLFNASPMSLMPSFEKIETKNAKSGSGSTGIAGFQRNDSVKMEPRGLTRITRHPLILPVVPWGFATSYLAGGRTTDFVLFGGLALYAIAGCACQDLRIIRKEGSVGTVMKVGTSKQLDDFYRNTSFMPFAAVVDGRQSMKILLKEFPTIPFIVGVPIGASIQDILLQILS